MNKNRTGRYDAELRRIPASGGGGCHSALLCIANYGRLAGVARDEVARDLAAHIHGSRKVTNSEIWAAVSKAFDLPSTHTTDARMRTKTPRLAVDGARLLNAIVKRGAAFDEAELWEASPVRIDWPPEGDAIEILRRLYATDDRLFIGARHDAGAEHIRPVSEWITRIEGGMAIPEHLIPNPLRGDQGQTKDGKLSYRADSCVAQFKFAVVEFDALPRKLQIQFWAGAKLSVVALIDSGGKSLHGWVRVDATNAQEWTQFVEGDLFDLLTTLGADATCKNEARLSRVPGHFRREKGHWQRVLYINPSGGPVIP